MISLRSLCLALAFLLVSWFLVPTAHGQGDLDTSLRLEGLLPAGGRTSATESWGGLKFDLTNLGPNARNVRVVVFYPARPDVQYARDMWVPPQSTISSWLLAGPAAEESWQKSRNIQYFFIDREGGEDRMLRPRGDDRIQSRAIPYQKREPTTAVLMDEIGPDTDMAAPTTGLAEETVELARTFRRSRGLSDQVSLVRDRFLLPAAEALEGLDHFVLAGNRLTADPVGRQAVRRWVLNGGHLWVLLDRVDADGLAGLLGDAPGFQTVDRVGLTTIRLAQRGADPARVEAREVEVPVDLVRVMLSPGLEPLHTVDGWPASFVKRVGRGKVIFSTLGARGWYKEPPPLPETAALLRSRTPPPTHPVALPSLEQLAVEIERPEPGEFKPADLAPLVTDGIGYTVTDRGTVALIFAGFLALLAGLGMALRSSRRPELIGWLAPAAAGVAAIVFVGLGLSSRRAVPPTAAAADVVVATTGSGEGSSKGVFGFYRAESGLAELGAERGGILELDQAELEGQPRRRVMTDLGAWHWENLALPAGVRLGTFRATVPTGPVTAVARFGPDGIEGRLSTGRFENPADAVIATPARQPVAVHLRADGTFTAGLDDVLPPGQFLTSAIVGDKQRQQQEVYRKLLGNSPPPELDGRTLLLAWTESAELPFLSGGTTRTVGSTLLVVPLEFERTAPGTPVAIPRGLIPYARLMDGRLGRVPSESSAPAEIRLRFQLPPAVLPLRVERATFEARVRASSRRVTVTGSADGQPVPLAEVDSPVEPIRATITDPRLLVPDAEGGITLTLSIGARADAASTDVRQAVSDGVWRIESLGLEVVGQTADK